MNTKKSFGPGNPDWEQVQVIWKDFVDKVKLLADEHHLEVVFSAQIPSPGLKSPMFGSFTCDNPATALSLSARLFGGTKERVDGWLNETVMLGRADCLAKRVMPPTEKGGPFAQERNKVVERKRRARGA